MQSGAARLLDGFSCARDDIVFRIVLLHHRGPRRFLVACADRLALLFLRELSSFRRGERLLAHHRRLDVLGGCVDHVPSVILSHDDGRQRGLRFNSHDRWCIRRCGSVFQLITHRLVAKENCSKAIRGGGGQHGHAEWLERREDARAMVASRCSSAHKSKIGSAWWSEPINSRSGAWRADERAKPQRGGGVRVARSRSRRTAAQRCHADGDNSNMSAHGTAASCAGLRPIPNSNARGAHRPAADEGAARNTTTTRRHTRTRQTT